MMFPQVLDSVGVDGSQASQFSSMGSQVRTITCPLSFQRLMYSSYVIVQVTVEVHTEGSSGMQSGYEALCLEILGLRCLIVASVFWCSN